ncbi:MAG: fluoride efflux transporter FluC [Ktedonobacteraceae bacterium]
MTVQTLSVQRRLLAVLGGGFLGTLVRYGISMVIQAWLGTGWPYDILLINLTGACALALLTTLADAALLIGPTRRLLLTTGLLGAYTTFSSLALGDVLLFNKGVWLLALLYLILSLFGGMLIILLGERLGQLLIASLRRSVQVPETDQDLQLVYGREQGDPHGQTRTKAGKSD